MCVLIFSGFHQQSYGDIEWHRTSRKFNVRIYLRWAVTQWKKILLFGYQKPGQFHCHRCDAGGFQREPWQGVSGAWGGNMEITALAATLNRPITVMRGQFYTFNLAGWYSDLLALLHAWHWPLRGLRFQGYVYSWQGKSDSGPAQRRPQWWRFQAETGRFTRWRN